MAEIQMRICRLQPEAILPTRATSGSSGWDIYAPERVVLKPGVPTVIGCGFAIALPPGHEAQIRPRSSLSKKSVHCAFGTIDNDYRGDVGVTLTKAVQVQPADRSGITMGNDEYVIEAGDRIAQMIIGVVPNVTLEEVDHVEELGVTKRGTGGFGSTGR